MNDLASNDYIIGPSDLTLATPRIAPSTSYRIVVNLCSLIIDMMWYARGTGTVASGLCLHADYGTLLVLGKT